MGFKRPFGEVVTYSANVWSYVTASENLWLFGKMLRYYPHGEGETFIGFVPWVLAAVAIARLLVSTPGSDPSEILARGQTPAPRPLPAWRRILIGLLVVAVTTQFIGVVTVVIFGGFDINVFGLDIRARTPQRLIWQFAGAATLLLIASARVRAVLAQAARSPRDVLRGCDGARDVAVAWSGAEGRRFPGVGLWAVRRALRVCARLQWRSGAGALRDDRGAVSRGARRLRGASGFALGSDRKAGRRQRAEGSDPSAILARGQTPSARLRRGAHPDRGRGHSHGDESHVGTE